MLLSHRHQFLFVHIAKTGGTSVRAALAPLLWRDPLFWLAYPCRRLSHLSGHRTVTKFPRHAKIIAAKEMLPHEVFTRLFKFAFVRNPWDLQVSSYHHLKRERPHLVAHVKDFSDFVRFKLDPERSYEYHLDTSIEMQSDYVKDLSGRIIVDFIGRYERLEEDFARVCDRLGIAQRPLPHKRQAKDRDDYRRYYDEVTADLVAKRFLPDIEAFRYSFE
ncbi:sulfotransferase [Sulfurifustis variabilis]|uniref:Sulfotransferase n=1 Tax=Sulfurifustis variabilis TaxID=1675686 RepID=A0A1C7AFY8_9GAMM|nr:sulfotransferase family 2 domain-containing protein [Sulfurifustis variabilis]BAU50348.1 sulfotransferase [Sulfurifustis variabilis]